MADAGPSAAMQTRTPEQVAPLLAAVVDEADADDFQRFLAAFGGAHRCLERFLIARDDDLGKAEALIRATLAFRREHRLDADPRPTLDPAVRALVEPLWPGSFAGATPDGSPIMLVAYGNLDVADLYAKVPEDSLRVFYTWFMEQTLVLQNRSNDAEHHDGTTPWHGMLEIHDLSGTGFGHLHIPMLRMLTRVLKIGQDHYPENLRKLWYINAPRIYSAAWAIISTAMSARTIAKVSIRSDDGGDELRREVGGAERLAEICASGR